MIHYIVVATREKRRHWEEMFDHESSPKGRLSIACEIARVYRSEQLAL
jgi:hypothetical protein